MTITSHRQREEKQNDVTRYRSSIFAFFVFFCRIAKKPFLALHSKRSVSKPLPIFGGAKQGKTLSSVC